MIIYTLKDTVNNKIIYVGQSNQNLRSRLSQHKYRMKNKNIEIEELEIVTIDSADFWEGHYISLFRSFGFDIKNKALKGGTAGYKVSKEQIEKNYKRKGNPAYCKPKGPMNEYGKQKIKEGSLKMFADKLGITKELVQEIYRLMEDSSYRKVAKQLNIPASRVYGIFFKKQYDYLLTN